MIFDENSSCIDAGTADLDGDGINDIFDYYGTSPDMGAYEYMPENNFDLGDINYDGDVNVIDIVTLVNISLSNEYVLQGDLNNDGINNILDIVILVNIVLSQ